MFVVVVIRAIRGQWIILIINNINNIQVAVLPDSQIRSQAATDTCNEP